MAAPIEINALTKRFDGRTAVDAVSFTAGRGEIVGVLGPNGAGKTTTMRMLAGFLAPDAGTARIMGHDVQTDGIAARGKLGFLPEGAPCWPEMRVGSFLRFVARVRGLQRQAAERAAELTQLTAVLKQPIDTLSKGFRRRVGLAQALLHDPPVLVLDEPGDGLDPNQKHELRRMILGMAGEKTIVISTHDLDEVFSVCTRAIVMARGRIVADAAPRELAGHGGLAASFRALTQES